MKTKKPRYQFEGHQSFEIMAALHQVLWPEVTPIGGSSRRAHQIFQALNAAYTAGIEDAALMTEKQLIEVRRRTWKDGRNG